MSELENTRENPAPRDPKTGQLLPGARLNPAGKPKGARHFTTLVREALLQIAKDPTTGQTEKMEVLLAKKAVLSALAGDTAMLKTIWSYLDGMPTAKIELDDVRKDETKEQLSNLIKKMNGGN